MDLPPVPAINEWQPTTRVLRDIVQYLVRLYNTLMGLQVVTLARSVTIAAADEFGNVFFPEVDDPARYVFWTVHGEPENDGDTYAGVSVTPFTITELPRQVIFHVRKPVTAGDKTYTISAYFRAR